MFAFGLGSALGPFDSASLRSGQAVEHWPRRSPSRAKAGWTFASSAIRRSTFEVRCSALASRFIEHWALDVGRWAFTSFASFLLGYVRPGSSHLRLRSSDFRPS